MPNERTDSCHKKLNKYKESVVNDLQSYILLVQFYILRVQFSVGQRLGVDVLNVAIQLPNANLGEWTTELK